MTLVYTSIFLIMLVELVLLVLLLLPLGQLIQTRLFYFLEMIQTYCKIPLYIMFSIIFILFANSVHTSIKSLDSINNVNHHHIMFDPYSHCKNFYAQRNIYLTAITLLIGLILYRIPRMIRMP